MVAGSPVDPGLEQTSRSSTNIGEESKVTICPRSSDPFYIVSYYIKLVTTSWTYSAIKLLTTEIVEARIKVIRKFF